MAVDTACPVPIVHSGEKTDARRDRDPPAKFVARMTALPPWSGCARAMGSGFIRNNTSRRIRLLPCSESPLLAGLARLGAPFPCGSCAGVRMACAVAVSFPRLAPIRPRLIIFVRPSRALVPLQLRHAGLTGRVFSFGLGAKTFSFSVMDAWVVQLRHLTCAQLALTTSAGVEFIVMSRCMTLADVANHPSRTVQFVT